MAVKGQADCVMFFLDGSLGIPRCIWIGMSEKSLASGPYNQLSGEGEPAPEANWKNKPNAG